MDAVFSFLFGTRTGFAILFAGGILLFAILAFVMEKRTHKMYVDRGPKSEDEEDSFLGLTCQKRQVISGRFYLSKRKRPATGIEPVAGRFLLKVQNRRKTLPK